MSWVEDAAKKINKEMGGNCPSEVLADAAVVNEWIPTGIDAVDRHLIGGRGLPVGKVVELYGYAGAGKSTLAMTTAIQCQKIGGSVIWAETEEALDHERFAFFGGDPSQVLLLRPDSIEDFGKAALVAMLSVPDHSRPTLLVWDSVAATASKAENENELESGGPMGSRARSIGLIMRVLLKELREHRTTLLAVNQVRQSIGGYGNPDVTPGGNALKFAASVRIKMTMGSAIKGESELKGRDVKIISEKTRWGPPGRAMSARLVYDKGWDNDWTTLNLAKDLGLVEDKLRISADNLVTARKALGW